MKRIAVEFGPSSPLKRAARRSADFANQPYNGWPELGRSRVNAAGSPSQSCSYHPDGTWQCLLTGCAATCFKPKLLEDNSEGELDMQQTLHFSFPGQECNLRTLIDPSGFSLAKVECAASQAHGRTMLLCGDGSSRAAIPHP